MAAYCGSAKTPKDHDLIVRLILRDRLVAEILELDAAPNIDLPYVDGRPNHDAFLPHLRQLSDNGVTAPITLGPIRTGSS